MKPYDAIVLGAGPAGSSAAYFLAQAGMRVAVVEKAPFPRRKVCGEFVSATSFPVLDAMGVGEAFCELGGPRVRRVGAFGGETVVTAPMPSADYASGWGRALPRARLDPMLLEAAQREGAEVYQPWKAVAMETTERGHVCAIEAEGTVKRLVAPVVVAAHGSWELGDLPTQLERSNRPGDLFAFKAFFDGASFDSDLMALLAFPGGYGGMVHNDDETVGLSGCVRRDVLQACRRRYGLPSAVESFLKHVLDTTRGVAESLGGATLVDPPLAVGPLRPGIRPRYANGVFRVGNAAGEAHPVIAEGISMAIQSGFLLGSHLAGVSGNLGDRRTLDVAGRAYARAWRAQFGGRIRAAEVYARLCMSPVAVKALGPLLARFPSLLTVGAVLSGKTKPLAVPRRFGPETAREHAH